MSIKTLRKRVSLVAVTALTAGVLSVVAAPAANAAYGSNVAAGTTTNPGIATVSVMQIATIPSTTGSGVAVASGNAYFDSEDVSAARSIGLVNVSDLAGGLTAGTTTTATLLSTGSISVYAMNATDTASSFVVTGGTITSSTGDALNGTATAAAAGTNDDVRLYGVVVKPSSGATSMTIQYYSGYTATASNSTDMTAVIGNPTGATGLVLEGQITVTIATASTAGVVSASNSNVYGAANGTQSTATLTSDSASYIGAAAFDSAMHLQVRIRDAFKTAISGTTGLLQVTATGGALVNMEAGNATTAGTTTTDFVSTASPDTAMIQVNAPSNAPVLTTVTVSWNGTVIGSKTLRFTGKVAKVEIYGAERGSLGGTSNAFYWKLSDASGNATYTTISAIASTAYPMTTLFENTAVRSGAVSSISSPRQRDYDLASNYSTVTNGRSYFTCKTTAGTGKLGLTYTNLDGSVVTSNVLDVNCAGDAVTYKASWDKASYIPGDLATLTVTGFDSNGNIANDKAAIATTLPVVSIGGLDKTITAPTTSDVFDGGALTYKYTIGATEGSYTGSVKFTTIDERYASVVSAAGAAAVTTNIVVKSGTTSVSNADVLKSIVALIASINKQIQALQKLILKR